MEDRKERGEFEIWNCDYSITNIDVLKFEPSTDQKYSVIANIPYYITSPILHHFLYSVETSPEKMVILMQKDVADKILWWKKNKSSVIKLFIEKKCIVTHIIDVPRESFSPAPKVESTVLLFSAHDNYNEVDDEKFLKVIKEGFAEPRKKLINNLVKFGYEKEWIIQILKTLWYSEMIRGEDIWIKDWIEIVRSL